MGVVWWSNQRASGTTHLDSQGRMPSAGLVPRRKSLHSDPTVRCAGWCLLSATGTTLPRSPPIRSFPGMPPVICPCRVLSWSDGTVTLAQAHRTARPRWPSPLRTLWCLASRRPQRGVSALSREVQVRDLPSARAMSDPVTDEEIAAWLDLLQAIVDHLGPVDLERVEPEPRGWLRCPEGGCPEPCSECQP